MKYLHPDTENEDLSASDREATELNEYESGDTTAVNPSLGQTEHDSVETRTTVGSTWTPVKKFWKRQISLSVPHHTCRDHLGMQ